MSMAGAIQKISGLTKDVLAQTGGIARFALG
jgi:hypothetical protein